MATAQVKAQMVVDSVVVEGKNVRATAQRYGVSKSWVHELVRRFKLRGEAALVPASKAPLTNARSIASDLEEQIVAMRKELCDIGADAGAETIHWHLERQGRHPPSVSTIYRLLKRRGFVTPEPRKAPTCLLRALRGDAPQRMLAVRHDPRAARRRHRRRDRDLPRRLLTLPKRDSDGARGRPP